MFYRKIKSIITILNVYKHFALKNYEKCLHNYQRYIRFIYSENNPKIINHNQNILKIAQDIFKQHNIENEILKTDFSNTKMLILTSEIYDTGGHTEVALRFANAFKDEYEIDFLLSGYGKESNITAPIKSVMIKKVVKNYVEYSNNETIINRIKKLYQYIIENKYTTLFVDIHMNDVVSCAVLGLLKQNTDINIIFYNHADHMYFLGGDFADVIVCRTKNGKAITPHLKDNKNLQDILFLESDNEPVKYSARELTDLKNKLGIPQDAFVTISGGASYKFGNDYFKLIKKIIDKYPNVYHVFISEINKKKISNIKKKTGKNANRIIFHDFVSNPDLHAQMSDLYIDSFPQGSALTLIDFIKQSKPVVIKINSEHPEKSFEMYLNGDYEYSCKTVDEMFVKTCELIDNKEKYNETSEKVRIHYEKTYDINTVKKKYRLIIK